MGILRKMHPQFFTKKAKLEREQVPKAPKAPKIPRLPTEPRPPEKYLKNNRQVLPIEIDCLARTASSLEAYYVSIPLSKIMEIRSQIKAEDHQINLHIQSSSGSCNSYGCYPEIDILYFEWHDNVEDPKYQKKFEEYQEKLKKYQEKLKKYHEQKEKYDSDYKQYLKDSKEYKKQLKNYQLEQMKKQKAILEKQIAKAEKNNVKI